MKKYFRHLASGQRRAVARGGLASLEVVMTIAVMLPITAAMLFLAVKICSTLYQVIGTLVGWPYL
jgi:hypothetical protein